ncbi:ATP-dependent DNA ligase [Pseudarthrobacter equi]|uniref:ATP-dependent DNA ligase n=1 Tax=Pseudarthrobacter equi TaxID=728066 RepID=UPI0028D06839|nr:ATP-dependent DNA ligase [Pseudarthrobacter equi]
MDEAIPRALQPPVAVALAKLVKTFPGPGALPGQLYAEPEWDGYRTVIQSDSTRVTLWSRQGKELSGIFPDLCAAVRDQVPPGVVLDGEAVIWNGRRLDFEALQRRMVSRKVALDALVHDLPASFAAFDVLAVAGQDIRGVPFASRRRLLDELGRDWTAPLHVSPTTTDMELARTWLLDLPATGMEGLVFMGGSQSYDGSRLWLKLKEKTTFDAVCAAVIGPISQPQAIIAGLPLEGQLRIVGRSTVLSTRVGRELGRQLSPAQPGHPWPEEISETSPNRFSKDKSQIRLTLIEPLVVEISADVAWTGKSFRHPISLHRARPELDHSNVELPPHLQNRY